MMRYQQGFTLIEVIVFIIITSLLMSTILIGSTLILRSSPNIHQQWIAIQSARECMEWFLSQRRLNSYTTLTCPSTPTAAACSPPSGFTVTTNVSCTTWNSDTNYKTITVTVSGLANASVSTQIGNY